MPTNLEGNHPRGTCSAVFSKTSLSKVSLILGFSSLKISVYGVMAAQTMLILFSNCLGICKCVDCTVIDA